MAGRFTNLLIVRFIATRYTENKSTRFSANKPEKETVARYAIQNDSETYSDKANENLIHN